MPIVNSVGQLNERITFRENQMVRGEGGVLITKQVDVFSTWAYVRQQYLNEIATTSGGTLENTITFVIRYDQPQPINTGMAIKWNGKTYQIVKANPDLANKQWTTLIAKEGIA